ncbi:DUF6371 domain-containing protein [Mucilaginibacter calamicampi]|uniref:DUF6371 domain-containing protein n=1 Tax=Mucilaginibacter calamicampi TaxID=1302352 RepID=A0ABW2Z2F5_9SPHI
MHRFTLQPYKTPSSRFTCPQCGQHKKFTRYINVETKTHVADHVGKCDRIDKCGYHYTPKQYFEANPHQQPYNYSTASWRPPPPRVIMPSTISMASLQATLKAYEHNYFVQYLLNIFEEETVNRLIEDYHIGTAKRWPGSVIFWQVDRNEKVRTGKIMLYDAVTGKRVKEPYSHIAWVHTLPGVNREIREGSAIPARTSTGTEFNLKQCFFGEHLLQYDTDALVAIVESEKTAVIASGYMPEHCWLAAGGVEGLTFEKCKPLKGRQVLLFPDAGMYDKWEERVRQLRIRLPDVRFGMARYTEGAMPVDEMPNGVDIADWLTGVWGV